jgi:hypothetical protein
MKNTPKKISTSGSVDDVSLIMGVITKEEKQNSRNQQRDGKKDVLKRF